MVGCQQQSTAPIQETVIPFPTVTPGQVIQGVLSTPNPVGQSALVRLATLDAQNARITPTPSALSCPVGATIALPDERPPTTRQVVNTLLDYLSEGGQTIALLATLRRDWAILGEGGFVRADRDLTGEGETEVIVAFTSPEDETGVLIILGCLDGAYVAHYEQESDDETPPEITQIIDMNRDQRSDLLITFQACDVNGQNCNFQSELITWRADLGRFVSLLNADLISDEPPETIDFDNDEVLEIVIRLENDGNTTTGPLRTGTSIYDWNGSAYVPSIIQPDPPQYRIQVIHEADRYFNARDMTPAVELYLEALDNEDLDEWFDDEEAILRSYVYYRLMLALAFLDQDVTAVYEAHRDEFTSELDTPYLEMSTEFYEGSFDTVNLTTLCNIVNRVIRTRPDALALINRYGNRNPTYTAEDLCPF